MNIKVEPRENSYYTGQLNLLTQNCCYILDMGSFWPHDKFWIIAELDTSISHLFNLFLCP